MDQAYVDYQLETSVAKITFAHPGHNALPSDLLEQLEQSIYRADKEKEVKVILLKSGGNRTFCAGADFDELLAIEDLESGKAFFSGFGGVINAIRKVNKLVVGRVQGKAVGGGLGLAAACDLAFATRYAAIRLSEISIGIGPFVIAPAVERKMGKASLANLSFQPTKWMSAEEAHRLGLYAQLFEDVNEMDRFIHTYLGEMCTYSPAAIEAMKRVLWAGTENWDELLKERAALSGELVLSSFTKNALNKFKQK
jgi:methylglutaconyl-CoA hydratase